MAMSFELFTQPIVAIVAAPLVGALLALVLGRLMARLAGWISVAASGATLVLALVLLWQAGSSPASFANPLPWWPFTPVPPTFYADITSAVLIVLVAAVALAILVSSCDRGTARGFGAGYFSLNLTTLGSTIALLLSQDLLTFYAAWEISTISVAFTILTRFDERAGAAAGRFLLSSLLLSVLTLFAIVWTGLVAGDFHFSALGRMAGLSAPEFRWLAAAGFLALALFRGAIVPFHIWMGKALESAHSQVAPLLFVALSATGFFAVLRVVLPHLPPEPEWHSVITALGLLTALSGSAAALRPKQASSILAYICVGQAGFVAVGFGIGGGLGIIAAVLQLLGFGVSLTLLNLALSSRPSLFDGVESDRWRQFALSQPAVFVAVAIALLGVAGVPPLGIFGARMVLLESLLADGSTTNFILLAGVFLTSALGIAAVARLSLNRGPGEAPEANQEPNSLWNRIPIIFLAIVSVLLGFSAHWLSSEVLARIAADSIGIPLRAAQTATVPWTIPVAVIVLLASLGAGVLIHAARSDSEEMARIPLFAATRRFALRLSFLSPLTRGFWKLADKGAFDIYPAISSLVNGFARVAEFVVYASAGRSAR